MKDVAACDKPRGGGKQPVIRGSPNGETQRSLICAIAPQVARGEPGEVKHLSTQRKRKESSAFYQRITNRLRIYEFTIRLFGNSYKIRNSLMNAQSVFPE